MKKSLILFALLYSCLLTIQAQNVQVNDKNFIEINAITSDISTSEKVSLEEQLNAYDVYEIDLPELRSLVLKNANQANIIFNFPNKKALEITIHENEIRSNNYRAVANTKNGPVELPREDCHTYAGYTDAGKTVRLSITNEHLSGYIKIEDKVLFIKSLHSFVDGASNNQIIAYYNSDQKNVSDYCDVKAEKPNAPTNKDLKDEEKLTPACTFVEFATDADFEFFTANASSTAITNAASLANINNTQGLYFDEFSLNFLVVFQNVFTTAADPYTETTSEGDAVEKEVEEEWTSNATLSGVSRDYVWLYTGKTITNDDGNNIGGSVWKIGAMCDNPGKSYGFMASITTLVFAHELGHALDAEHDDAEDCDTGDPFPTIMCPTAIGNLVFSSENHFKIRSHILNSNCLSNPNPVPNQITQTFESGIGAWTQVTTDDMNWTRTSGSTPSTNTGPTGAYQGSFYLYTEASGNSNKVAQIVSQPYLVCQPNRYLSFGWHMYGSNMGSLSVHISNDSGNNWIEVWGKKGNYGNTWHTAGINLSNFNTQTILIRFTGNTGPSFRSDMAIDDIAIGGLCKINLETENVQFSANGGTESVFLDAGGAWEGHVVGLIDWLTVSPFIFQNGINITAAPNLSNSPRSGTVIISCGPSRKFISVYQEGVPTNPCISGFATLPNNLTFESTSLNGWIQDAGDDFDWRRNSGGTTSSGTGPGSAAQGNFYMYTEATNNFNNVANLISPCYDLAGVPSPKITFSYHMFANTPSHMGTLRLQVSHDGGSTWSTLWSETGNQGTDWIDEDISLAGHAGSPFRLRFNGTTGPSFQSDIAIDDIEVKSGTCYDQYEANNTLNTAYIYNSNIGSGGSVTLSNACLAASDNDYYRFTYNNFNSNFYARVYGNSGSTGDYRLKVSIVENTLIVETLPQNGSTTDTYLFLYTGSGFPFASDNNSGTGLFSKITTFLPFGPGMARDNEETEMENYSRHSFSLKNYPNPFNQTTNFDFYLAKESNISLIITDLSGKVVAMPIGDVFYKNGNHKIEFDASILPAGVYNYSLKSEYGVETKQMVIVR